MNKRETFCYALANGPLLPASAVVVLSGDGMTRVDAALGLFRQAAAHWAVVTGGVDNPPHSYLGKAMGKWLIERGLHPSRLVVENEARNTHEQAEWLAAFLAAPPQPWDFHRVLLVTSPYHMPRAYLTVLRSLQRAALDEAVHVLPVPASQTSWWGTPDGLEVTRAELFQDELRKIEDYRALYDHVASYGDGLRYLEFWEGHKEATAV